MPEWKHFKGSFDILLYIFPGKKNQGKQEHFHLWRKSYDWASNILLNPLVAHQEYIENADM